LKKAAKIKSAPKEPEEPVRPHCYLARLRAIAIVEYGMSGWVDPRKIAPKIPLLECQVCRGLEHLGGYERINGEIGTGYRQRRPGEAKA